MPKRTRNKRSGKPGVTPRNVDEAKVRLFTEMHIKEAKNLGGTEPRNAGSAFAKAAEAIEKQKRNQLNRNEAAQVRRNLLEFFANDLRDHIALSLMTEVGKQRITANAEKWIEKKLKEIVSNYSFIPKNQLIQAITSGILLFESETRITSSDLLLTAHNLLGVTYTITRDRHGRLRH